ncbi:MAG: flavohemoglobin expression-modulating QEGLA motif protein [Nanoarchaeota archaeon]|nr:flavohemoglobin expression-modulating QEGLA motif protein [Nanoarchaeota archaeon]
MPKDILKEADEELHNISQKISFLAINPTNETREKKKFFADKGYEPQFIYEPYRTNIDRMIETLKAITTDRSMMGNILRQKKEEHIRRFMMLKYRGLPEFTDHSAKVFGRPNKQLLTKAKRLLYAKEDKVKENLKPKDVIDILKAALALYGFNWEVKQKNMTAKAAVNQSKKQVLIKKGKNFSNDFIKRLITHEIGTHVLRYENGLLQPYKIFATGLPGYFETEEGLAVVNEEKAGVLQKRILKVYAARTIAVGMARDKGFREIYEYMRKFFRKEEAWKITVRAKRGIGDTSKPGGLTKDYLYLNGYYKVKNYLKKYSVNRLYYGKVSMSYAKMLDRIPGLVEPKYLPKIEGK